MKWEFIDTDLVDKHVFGFTNKIFACKVAQWHGNSDIRGFELNGWKSFAELSDIDPINGKSLKRSKWFIYCAKGE